MGLVKSFGIRVGGEGGGKGVQSTPIAVIARHRWNRKSKSLTTKDTKNEKVDRLNPTQIWDTRGCYGMNGEGVGDRRNRRHRATSPESEKQELNHKGRKNEKVDRLKPTPIWDTLGWYGMNGEGWGRAKHAYRRHRRNRRNREDPNPY